MAAVARVGSAVGLLAISVWLGGLLALGTIVAPVVFSMVSWPANADAMTVVFRRFDLVAMTCAAVVLAAEAARAMARVAYVRGDHVRVGLSSLAAALAVFEGVYVSPRIALLHVGGAIRGVGAAGEQLAGLHDWAELCGKTEVVLLAVIVAIHGLAATAREAPEKK